MRLATYILTTLITFGYPYMPLEQSVYPETDKTIIVLWKAALEKDKTICQSAIKQLSNKWIKTSAPIKELKSDTFNTEEFMAGIKDIILSIQSYINTDNYTMVEDLSYQLLLDFNSMRNCIGINNYALDDLLNMYDTYNEIHYTVHDPMLGLRNWFEFQDLIDDFIESWDSYLCTQDKEIKTYFTGINLETHTLLKQKLNTCLDNFIQSLDSGYRTDFEIPCDIMGEAVRELIWLYAESKTNI